MLFAQGKSGTIAPPSINRYQQFIPDRDEYYENIKKSEESEDSDGYNNFLNTQSS